MKKAISFCLVFAITLGTMLFAVPAYAKGDSSSVYQVEKSIVLNKAKTEASWELEVTAGKKGGCMAGLSAYSSDGRMLGASVTPYDIKKGKNTFGGTYQIPAEAVIIKLFVWESETGAPLVQPLEKNLSAGDSSEDAEIDYEKANKDMISHLKAVQQDIADNILEFNGMSVTLIYYISECIKEAIADADSHIINKAYLKENHGGEDGYLTKAKNCFYEIKADPSAKASFSEEIACLNPDTITWLLDAFDVDKDQLIK